MKQRLRLKKRILRCRRRYRKDSIMEQYYHNIECRPCRITMINDYVRMASGIKSWKPPEPYSARREFKNKANG